MVFAKELGIGMKQAVKKAQQRNVNTGRQTLAIVTSTYGSSPHFHELIKSGLARYRFVEGRMKVKGAKNASPHSAIGVAFP